MLRRRRLAALVALAGALSAAALMPAAGADLALVTEEEGLFSVMTGSAEAGITSRLIGPMPMQGQQWAWTGERLAYLTAAGDAPGLHVLDIPALTDTPVSGPDGAVSLHWAPDCTQIAYATYDPDAKLGRIYVTTTAGGPPVVVSGDLNAGLAVDYSFSHESAFLAFGVPDPVVEGKRALAVTNLATGQVQSLDTFNAHQWAWSPSAPTLAMLASTVAADGTEGPTKHLLLMDFSRGVVGQPVSVSRVGEGVAADVLAFEWSPTGEYVAFRTELDPGAGRLFMVNSASKRSTMVKGTTNVVNYAFAPDGRTFFVQDAEPDARPSTAHLRVGDIIEPFAGDTWLVRDSEGAGRLAWAPDCQSLAYVRDRNLYLIDIEARDRKLLCEGVAIEALSWRPDGQCLVAVMANRRGTALALALITPHPDGVGATVKQISGDFRCSVSLDWSPDGAHLLVLAHFAVDVAKSLVFSFGPEGDVTEKALADSVATASWYPRPRP